jgi:acetyl esterase/lipase
LKAAVCWLRANAADYGLDPDRIATGGASSGRHLASLA